MALVVDLDVKQQNQSINQSIGLLRMLFCMEKI